LTPDPPFGVYVHFPYCLSACPYCDFAFTVARRGRGIPHEAYADAVCAELAARAAEHAGRTLGSIYFGGGTPGLWDPACLGRVVAAVCRCFGADPRGLEITVEVNPADERVRGGLLGALGRAGANRLSIGAQSTSDRLLRKLGRMHRGAQVAEAVEAARAAGFADFSLDLMLGVPGQSAADLERDLDALLALDPPHLSAYALTVEPGTVFARRAARGTLAAADDDLAADLYERTRARLVAAGFVHYEISSFARGGRRSRHNELHWTGGEWLGLGASAWSSRRLAGGGIERRANHRGATAYLAAPTAATAERELLDPAQAASEAVWLGLRRVADGVPEAQVAPFRELVARLCAEGLLERPPGRVRLTGRGILLADEIALRFL
jgi:oxygen-independent coproporphyrinogen-3 oxidase